jgi:tripartite-type tricarboxylate transporter receptor subunit TctC
MNALKVNASEFGAGAKALRSCRTAAAALFGLGIAAVSAASATAQTAEEFYRGKTVNVIVGYAPGGGYDLYARLLARHMSKHIPGNPSLVVQNMPGAGSMKAALYLNEVAPKDGTYFGTTARAVPLAPLLQNAKFDGSAFSWIGSISDDVGVCLTSSRSKAKTFNDLLTGEVMMAGEGATSDLDMFAHAVNNIFGAKMKIITGFHGTSEITLAMDRGEVDGMCGMSLSTIRSRYPDWIAKKQVNFLLQIGLKKDPALPQAPLMVDLAKDHDQQQTIKLVVAGQAIARPFFGPPGMPADRKAALRAAFDKTMTDPEFVAEAKKQAMDINPMSGAEVDALLKDIYSSPKSVVEKAARAIVK